MNDRECDQVYETLVGFLNQNRLDWIAAQVADQIRLGKTIEREIETLREGRETGLFAVDPFPSRLRKGPKAKFPVTVDYKPSERLTLLVDAIEQAIVCTSDMEHHLVEYFEKDGQSWSMEFHNDEPGSQPKSLNREAIISRAQSSRKLKELLDALRKNI